MKLCCRPSPTPESLVTTFSNNGYYYTGLTDPQTPTARTVTYGGLIYPELLST